MAENMLVADALAKIDMSKPDCCDIGVFERTLNTNTSTGWHEDWDARVKRYGISTWWCSDTKVGVHAVFLDGVFVAITTQKGRKSDVNIAFASIAMAARLTQFIIDLDPTSTKVDVLTDESILMAHWFDTVKCDDGAYVNVQH